LSIEQFLIVSPIVFYGFYAALLGWSVVFGRHKRQPLMLEQAGHAPSGSVLKPGRRLLRRWAERCPHQATTSSCLARQAACVHEQPHR
jgi:hypothetical protein